MAMSTTIRAGGMQRSHSGPALLHSRRAPGLHHGLADTEVMPDPHNPSNLFTRRRKVGDHIGGAIPGYQGHVPGARIEDTTFGHTFVRQIDAARTERSHPVYDHQAIRIHNDIQETRQRGKSQPARAPEFDKRGIGHPAAGDTFHSRIAVQGEERSHYHSSLGLTSLAHEDRGSIGKHKGYGSAARGIPGFTGYVPGKVAENVYADTWSKSNERSIGQHFKARISAPKNWSVMTEGGTAVAALPADSLAEVPIRNPSYQDRTRGWSVCAYSGAHIDPAGRACPKDMQEGYGGISPPRAKNQIHGYAGWVPGRVGENVVGERQCKTNDVSNHLFKKACMRITQR